MDGLNIRTSPKIVCLLCARFVKKGPVAPLLTNPTLSFIPAWLYIPDIPKVDFLHGQNFSFKMLCKKKLKNITKITYYVWKMKKTTVKEVKMHNFLVCACKSQDFTQSQKNFARSYDRETVTFKNSGTFYLLKYICNPPL